MYRRPQQDTDRFNIIKRLTNPGFQIMAVKDPKSGIKYNLVDDGLCIGGSKQRLLGNTSESRFNLVVII